MVRLTLLFAAVVGCGGRADDTAAKGMGEEEICPAWFRDLDGDGFGDDGVSRLACEKPKGWRKKAGDCDDGDPTINPGGTELCDTLVDEDCDGLVDDDDDDAVGKVDSWPDLDGDGFGDLSAAAVQTCALVDGNSDNALDCVDDDADTFPGAAENEDPQACMRDQDGDGWGDDDPPMGADMGTDCDDSNVDLSPGTPEIFGDGFDQNCDGEDAVALLDDFEGGGVVWSFISGDAGTTTDYAAEGLYSLNLGGGGGEARSISMDLTNCLDLVWSYEGKRGPDGPDAGDRLQFEFRVVGGDWTPIDSWVGDGTEDPEFSVRDGVIVDAAIFSPGVQVRLISNGTGVGNDDFFVDNFLFGCPGPDLDGDGVYEAYDCDDGDPRHWEDCGVCVDGDGDGYGLMCDLGDDCDELDAAVNAGAPDLPGDALDENCDGFDGVALFDDFELGAFDPSVFGSIGGDANVTANQAYAGAHSLHLGGGLGIAVSVPANTLDCPQVTWSYAGLRGPDAPENDDFLILQYDAGAGWVQTDVWPGTGFDDVAWTIRGGVIDDPLAVTTNALEVRLSSMGDAAATDDFYVDDFLVGCPVDLDADGFGEQVDCDDADPLHWVDCGLCVDGDGDGYGVDCDLGVDCDDLDAAINPGIPEINGDGIDQNCDGFDVGGLFDSFDSGAADPLVWTNIIGDAGVVNAQAFSGLYSLNMGGAGGTAETATLDASACSAVEWSYSGKRGPEQPDNNDTLELSYFDSTGAWIIADTWYGAGSIDPAFSLRGGTIVDGDALHSGFKVRLISTGSGANFDDYFIDDVSIFCP